MEVALRKFKEFAIDLQTLWNSTQRRAEILSWTHARERITVQDDGYLASRSDSSESENDSRKVSTLTFQEQIQELTSQRAEPSCERR